MNPVLRTWAIFATLLAVVLALRGAWPLALACFLLSPAPAWTFGPRGAARDARGLVVAPRRRARRGRHRRALRARDRDGRHPADARVAPAMIRGVHAMFYSSKADALRAFLRDTLGFRGTDVGEGWLIFDVPEADMGVHPTGEDGPPSGTARPLVLLRRHPRHGARSRRARRRVHAGRRGPRLRLRHLHARAGGLPGPALPGRSTGPAVRERPCSPPHPAPTGSTRRSRSTRRPSASGRC